MFGTIYLQLMLISNRFVLLKRFYRTLPYLHIYVNEAPIRCALVPFKTRSELFYLSLYVPCYILSLVRIGFYLKNEEVDSREVYGSVSEIPVLKKIAFNNISGW